jgi:NAD+ diphosphatase
MPDFHGKILNFYSGGLDRASHLRKDEAWLAEKLSDGTSLFVPVWRGHNLIAEGEAPHAVFLAPDAIATAISEAVLLGLHEERAFFACDLSEIETPQEVVRAEPPAQFIDLRRVGPLLPRHEGSLLAFARGIAYWHSRHRFCGLCGSPTKAEEAGHVRRCTDSQCNAPHFPRTDPAVIMLVHDGDRCLLGRQAAWPKGMHSTLAGFVEPGEALEETVRREVYEEAGVEVVDMQYRSSQPWPFPASLMLGFRASAHSDQLRIDPEELVDAGWYTRAQLIDPERRPIQLPNRDSIARHLIEDWLYEGQP